MEDSLQPYQKREVVTKQESTLKDTLGILSQFISKSIQNYSIYDWKKGDINYDTKDDFVVVLQSDAYNEELTGLPETYHRKIVLVETIDFPNIRIASQNDYIIGCSDCGGAGVGDPYRGITIKNNYFSLEQLFGSCDKEHEITTFNYRQDQKDWFLYKLASKYSSCPRSDNEDEIVTVPKGKTTQDFGEIRFKDYNTRITLKNIKK
jgi:hypothetical protein